MLRALKSPLDNRRRHVLRWLLLYGYQALICVLSHVTIPVRTLFNVSVLLIDLFQDESQVLETETLFEESYYVPLERQLPSLYQ